MVQTCNLGIGNHQNKVEKVEACIQSQQVRCPWCVGLGGGSQGGRRGYWRGDLQRGEADQQGGSKSMAEGVVALGEGEEVETSRVAKS